MICWFFIFMRQRDCMADYEMDGDDGNKDDVEIVGEAKKRNGLAVFREALDEFAKNRDQDVTVYSEVPKKCKVTTCYVGIDEAGRGPVLGPMVYGIFAAVEDTDAISAKIKKGQSLAKIEECPPVLIDSIKKLNDSKQINEKTRDEVFAQFSDLDHIVYGVKIISPTQISAKSYQRKKISLNEISHNAAIELIQGLIDRGIVIGKVYVDTVGPMEKYQAKLEQLFPELKFKVDKKADSKYKPVSAASVCAKVMRDEALKKWTFGDNCNVKVAQNGWGSDEVTKKFLRANIDPVFGFPNIVRDSWSTASDLLEKRAVKIKWELDEDDAPVQKISKFFVKQPKTEDNTENFPVSVLKPKAQFFSYRSLTQTTKLF
ncbi:Ribonuclease H2 subunit A [Folsomia candida]|uniref:Ribonuclease n=1 Tax=Folsomia candida TaxID=158441 RepID=A0A226DFZ7_FOLCA|nr:Ribonuclease H2 subunit A [Folsomia candida]